MYKTTQTLDVWILKMNTGQAGAGVNGNREADLLGPKASIIAGGHWLGDILSWKTKNATPHLSFPS